MKWALALALPLVFACGGGLGGGEKSVSVSGTFSPPSLEVQYDTSLPASISVEFAVSSSDVISKSVSFNKLVMVYKGLDGRTHKVREVPLGFSLKAGERTSLSVEVFWPSDRTLEPYVYLSPNNPSSFVSVPRSVVLASPVSFVIGIGDGTRTNFSATLAEPVSVGTCQVVAGSQTLNETSLGVLTGNGSGVVSETSVSVSFSTAPNSGVHVILSCLSQMSAIDEPYTELSFSYADKTYYEDGGLIKDGNVVVGRMDGSRPVLLSAIGFKNSPFTAHYVKAEGGGEKATEGNGGRFYRFRTKYAPIDASSVKVVAKVGSDLIYCDVLNVNENVGEVDVQCSADVPVGSSIYVYYVLKEVLERVELFVDTSEGRKFLGTLNLRVVP